MQVLCLHFDYIPFQNAALTKEEFKKCFDQYFDPIRNYLYYRSSNAELATDITQEVFMKLWEKQKPFEGSRTKSLLYKMASNALIDQLRKNKVADKHVNSLPLHLEGVSPDENLQYQDLKKQYEQVLAELPENQRTVFLMSRVEGLTYKEMAARLDLSVKAIEKRMHLALNTLKERLSYHGK